MKLITALEHLDGVISDKRFSAKKIVIYRDIEGNLHGRVIINRQVIIDKTDHTIDELICNMGIVANKLR